MFCRHFLKIYNVWFQPLKTACLPWFDINAIYTQVMLCVTLIRPSFFYCSVWPEMFQGQTQHWYLVMYVYSNPLVV